MLPILTAEILRKLSKSDVKRLGDFLHSPYFNSKETICSLYKIIEKNHPDFKSEKLDYKKVYAKIYGTPEYKEQTIKNLYSEFGGLLRKFIAHERIETNETDYSMALILGLRDQKCFEQSNKFIDLYRKSFEKTISFDESNLLYLFDLEFHYFQNILSMNRLSLEDYHSSFNVIMDNLTYFFISTFFSFAKEDFIVKKAHKFNDDKSFANREFLENFNSEKFLNSLPDGKYNDAIKISYLTYKYTTDDVSEEQYVEYKKLIISNIDKFSTAMILNSWGNLLTMVILKLVPLNKEYYNEAFEINKFFAALNLFPNKEGIKISISMFRDVFGVALVLKKFDWAEKFISENSEFLEDEARENEVNYAKGRLNFQLRNYGKSLEYLNKVKFQQVTEKINVRFYYLMNYIELKSYQSAISMLNSIRQFYSESKEIPEMFAVLMDNSLKYFREIIRIEENNKTLDFSILKEAQNAGRYYQKQYILEKMQTLIK